MKLFKEMKLYSVEEINIRSLFPIIFCPSRPTGWKTVTCMRAFVIREETRQKYNMNESNQQTEYDLSTSPLATLLRLSDPEA